MSYPLSFLLLDAHVQCRMILAPGGCHVWTLPRNRTPLCSSPRGGLTCKALRPRERTALLPEAPLPGDISAPHSEPSGHLAVSPGPPSPLIPPGYLELIGVSLLWGSYNPAVRYLFNEQASVDPATLTFLRSALSATVLASSAAFSAYRRGPDLALPPPPSSSSSSSSADPSPSLSPTSSTSSAPASAAGAAPAAAAASGAWLARTSDSVLLAGLELGLWNFLGTALQAQGLQQTTATRAAFLIQCTAALTPVVARAAGIAIPLQVWAAVALGITGSSMVAWDGIQQAAADAATAATAAAEAVASGTTSAAAGGAGAAASAALAAAAAPAGPAISGEAFLLMACIFYALATVRLSLYAPKMRTIDLAAVKKASLTAFALGWLVVDQHQAGEVAQAAVLAGTAPGPDLFHSLWALPAATWVLIAYTGLGPGASATYLQTRGQALVPATQAQVIFSLTPLWSALFAYLTLGAETTGPVAWAGGALIVGAGLLATGQGEKKA